MSSPFYIVNLPVPPSAWVIRKKCWALLDILIYASTTQKDICSFELSLFSRIPIFVYQLIVRSNCAFVLSMLIILVVRQAILFRMTRRNKLQYLIHIQDWVKAVVFRRSNANPAFVLFYPEVLPSWCQECHDNCTNSYEFLMQWYFPPSSFAPRFRVVATGIPTSEPWCVKSILLATSCLVVNGQYSHS